MSIASSGEVQHFKTRSCVNTARAAALAVLLCVIAVILAYVFRLDSLITLKTGLTGMSLPTAIAITDLALALLAQSWGHARLAKLGGWLAAAIGFSILGVHLYAHADKLSPVLEGAFGFAPNNAPTVSVATAISVSMLGLTILTTSRAVLSDWLALGVTLITSFALLGYAYGVSELYALPLFHTMALHTASALLTLSVISILMRPQSNWCAVVGASNEGSAATRRQLLFMAVPIVVGWLLLRAINFQTIGPAAAMALLVIATVASLGVLIMRDGQRIVQLDAERRSKMEMHEALSAQMTLRLKSQADEILNRTAQQALAETAAMKAQRLEALSRLTGGIAHDFNNLLQAISGGVELIGRRATEGKPVNTLLDGVRNAMQRGAKLGSQLLTFSRTQKLNIRALPLDDLLLQAQSMLKSAVGSNVAIHCDFQTSGQIIFTDDAQFDLALLNLALNAKDAMRGRGELRLATSLVDPFVSIRMTDNGEGMNPETLARALEPFFSTKPEGTASGLGLSQVHGFMRQCRGELKISSEPGRGTLVELRFPTQHELTPSSPSSSVQQTDLASDPSQQLIVVIEDDDAVRHVIVAGLEEAGYQVAEASDGDAGILLLRSRKPSAAVIDFLMPTITGAEVAKAIRVDQPDLPIVFMSGHFETAALEGLERTIILRKPFELSVLRKALTDFAATKSDAPG